MLHELARDLWVVDKPQRFYGLEVGARMTVIRLADGSLLLHSPVSLDPELRRELDSRGDVRYAVAPNRFHHLYVGEVARAYPGARTWVAPGVESKRPDLEIAGVLDDEPPSGWKSEVDQLFFRGRPFENEVVFFHRASRTLMLCDLAFNFGPGSPPFTRLVARLLGSYRHFGPSRLDPFLIRDRAVARQCMERILDWDFDRVVVAHGEVVESGGREALREGYAWLLADRR
jgi:hypothetical protein